MPKFCSWPRSSSKPLFSIACYDRHDDPSSVVHEMANSAVPPASPQEMMMNANANQVGPWLSSSESFGTIPHHSEDFGKLPHTSESFGISQPKIIKTENHTMTVREAARAFENAGVARTERSITNWCQLNRQGVSRLDCYFEENDHKYFITPQSVDRAIKEELAKAREVGVLPNASERATEERKEEPQPSPRPVSESVSESTPESSRELELKNRDLEIASRVKDALIEELKKDRERLMTYQETLVEKMVDQSRMIGSLETKLLQIEAPRQDRPNASEGVREAEVEHPPSYA